MPCDEDRGRGSRPVAGLLEAARRFLASGVDMARLRVELLRVEAQEEIARLCSTLLFGTLALLFFTLATICASVLLVTALWDTHRLWALGGLALFHLLIAIVLVLVLRRRATKRAPSSRRSAPVPRRRATDPPDSRW